MTEKELEAYMEHDWEDFTKIDGKVLSVYQLNRTYQRTMTIEEYISEFTNIKVL